MVFVFGIFFIQAAHPLLQGRDYFFGTTRFQYLFGLGTGPVFR